MDKEQEQKNQEQLGDIQKQYDDIAKEVENHSISVEELYAWFTEEIKRRDEQIDKLKNENLILLKTALRNQERELDSKEKQN